MKLEGTGLGKIEVLSLWVPLNFRDLDDTVEFVEKNTLMEEKWCSTLRMFIKEESFRVRSAEKFSPLIAT